MIANGIRVRSVFTQDCRPGAFSVVPTGLVSVGTHTQHCVLGYSQPSLRDCSRHTLIADLFSASAVQINRSRKANLDKSG
jgi:hypothetical protein